MQYLIYNETDGIYAYPRPVSRAEGERIISELKMRYERQGYYASAHGRIPISDLSLILIEAQQ